MRSRTLSLAAASALLTALLGCSGLFEHDVHLREVDRSVMVDHGYTVPIEARGIYVFDRSTAEGRTTWFRYTLPREPMRDLREDLLDDPAVVAAPTSDRPEDWPDFAMREVPPPEWWVPQGEVFRREVAATAASPVASGHQWALTETGEVYVWMWEWEGWRLQPDRPTVGNE